MSVPDRHLPWWRPAHRPDGDHCDRNGCDRLARVTVTFEWYEGGYEACQFHGAWWQSRPGPPRLDRATVTPHV